LCAKYLRDYNSLSDYFVRMRTVIVLKGYPRLSETFIAQEILELERRGLDVEIVSLRHPTDKKTHPVHDQIKARVSYLPEYLFQEAGRVLRAWRRVRQWPTYRTAFSAWWRDFKRDRTPNRIRRFGQALVLAAELPNEIERLHAHFLHTPASVTRYAALLTGLPWSCSAHAVDIWTTPKWEIAEKLAELDWLVTCTAANQAYLAELSGNDDKVHLAYHGLDLSRFPAREAKIVERDGSDPDNPVTILSVGRAVEKKGYPNLLAALALLPTDLNWRFVHVGGGKEIDRLKRIAKQWNLEDRIDWLGSRSQDEVLRAYGEADIFALASRVAGNGDRDGLPNVLMEAQSQGLAVVSTRVSAIPELIEDGVSGLLVEQEDAEKLSNALARLIQDPSLRRSLAEAGIRRIRDQFEFQGCFETLYKLFGLSNDEHAANASASEKVA